MGIETALIIGGIAAAGATTATGIYGAKKASSTALEAARIQRDSANRAAELEDAANQRAEAFMREQMLADQQRFETTQHANYDQNAARERRIGTLGNLIGAPAREIPAYRPTFGSGAAGGGGGAPIDPKLNAAIATFKAQNPASVGIAPLTAALKAQGFNVDRYDYGKAGGLSNNELNVPGVGKYKVLGGEDSPQSAYWYEAGTDDSAPGAVMPGTLASYVGGTPAPGYAYGRTPSRSAALVTPAFAQRRYVPGSLGALAGG